MTQSINFVVDQHLLLNVGIARRDIGFGLVVIVVADEVLDGVVVEECFEFLIELGGQGLVVTQD